MQTRQLTFGLAAGALILGAGSYSAGQGWIDWSLAVVGGLLLGLNALQLLGQSGLSLPTMGAADAGLQGQH
ncbi:hypothetical protein [Biformimicrobium ophioploci]|uniref:YeeE/YedE family protein n=1 Tax=Biformimicrobium ophioploci TaxID=3036711 RepID=A0ABQ6LVJ2_9GAMM|nr:hypothetical protein [Microbulbifer sp. NKW57]GMG86117.1 hypothetical protein MNKW57_04380 [Microbulbifer sp. NKW57]